MAAARRATTSASRLRHRESSLIERGSTLTRFVLQRDHDGTIMADNTASGGQPPDADNLSVGTIPLVGCGLSAPVGSTFTATMTEYTPERTSTNGSSAVCTVTAAQVGKYPLISQQFG